MHVTAHFIKETEALPVIRVQEFSLIALNTPSTEDQQEQPTRTTNANSAISQLIGFGSVILAFRSENFALYVCSNQVPRFSVANISRVPIPIIRIHTSNLTLLFGPAGR
jgi:hypothetical protein